MAGARFLPEEDTSDWHLAIRLSLYPGSAKLYAYTYTFTNAKKSPTRQLFSPRKVSRPTTEWEAIQNLEQGLDILVEKINN